MPTLRAAVGTQRCKVRRTHLNPFLRRLGNVRKRAPKLRFFVQSQRQGAFSKQRATELGQA
jgi:hypothetical protein